MLTEIIIEKHESSREETAHRNKKKTLGFHMALSDFPINADEAAIRPNSVPHDFYRVAGHFRLYYWMETFRAYDCGTKGKHWKIRIGGSPALCHMHSHVSIHARAWRSSTHNR